MLDAEACGCHVMCHRISRELVTLAMAHAALRGYSDTDNHLDPTQDPSQDIAMPLNISTTMDRVHSPGPSCMPCSQAAHLST